jgi:hypothetical protein
MGCGGSSERCEIAKFREGDGCCTSGLASHIKFSPGRTRLIWRSGVGRTRLSREETFCINEIDLSRLTGDVTLTDSDFIMWSYRDVSLVTWAQGLVSIGNCWFHRTNIASLDLRETRVRRLGRFAFANCGSLVQLRVPRTLESIEYGCFDCTSLEDVALSHCRSLVLIGPVAFRGTPLHRLLLPAHSMAIGESIYSGTNLSEFQFGGIRNYGREVIWLSDQPAAPGDVSRAVIVFRAAEHVCRKSMFPSFGPATLMLLAGSASFGVATARPLGPSS